MSISPIGQTQKNLFFTYEDRNINAKAIIENSIITMENIWLIRNRANVRENIMYMSRKGERAMEKHIQDVYILHVVESEREREEKKVNHDVYAFSKHNPLYFD